MGYVKLESGYRYDLALKKRAVYLRKAGKTHREIMRELGISLGSADLWTKGVKLTNKQKKAVFERRAEKVYTKEVREKIGRARREYSALHPFQKYSNEDLLEKIKDFHKREGRIPLKREFNALKIYRLRFGSWNNAVQRAGFVTNPVLFAHKFVSKDGHKCDSFTEKVIDDWLFEKHVSHQRNFRYGDTKMTGDFLLEGNKILEFFGLAGEQKKYDLIIKRKRKLAKNLDFKLIEVYPKDIYPENRLAQLI